MSMRIIVSGASEVDIEGNVQDLDVDTSGASKFEFKGNAKGVTMDLSVPQRRD